jgi:hypothetical protein
MNRPVPYFDPYGQPPPDGEWEYVVDDFGMSYGPGWWPLYRDGEPCSVRLAPDIEYRSWRNEYVIVRPSADACAVAEVMLYCRRHGLGGMVVDARISIDLRERTATVISDLSAFADQIRENAREKGRQAAALPARPAARPPQRSHTARNRPRVVAAMQTTTNT